MRNIVNMVYLVAQFFSSLFSFVTHVAHGHKMHYEALRGLKIEGQTIKEFESDCLNFGGGQTLMTSTRHAFKAFGESGINEFIWTMLLHCAALHSHTDMSETPNPRESKRNVN